MIFQDAAAYAASGFAPKVCVIGAGPAGITIARRLAAAGIPVALLEAGSNEWTEESQDAYKGVTVGDPYFDLDATRLRYFGGSSNHWAGWCRILESYDFEPKTHIRNSGWPIRRSDIEPHFDETYDILGLSPFRPDVPITDTFRLFQVIKSEPVRFGEKYAAELGASKTIAVVLNTEVTELSGDGRSVTGGKLWSRGQAAGEIHAPYFVVATGGLENSRLLLWSNERSNGGVVPNAAALGRYWMEHPMYITGDALITNQAFELDHEGEAFFMPSPEAIARLELPNFHVQLETAPYRGVKAMIAGMACYAAPETTEWLSHKLGQRLQCTARVHMDWEQLPREHNRVALSTTERDAAGVPRIELHWKKDESDRRVMLEGMRLFGEEFARKDLGRIHISEWVRNGEDYPDGMEIAGNHHMGGTRMSDDPKLGVVDRDCKVHGMSNLFVGGSSVFATSGQCTPTTTIVTLALRLGEHLSRTISNS
ncbi:FAD-dependent oxidoreductase [Mesorhizobium sp. AaZ16]|uniref:FAD-dependent oxidoreductase n=1 Tax=Mesorhizobium sp. AaZ16 TaxID=3402289 RepID=UPI00374F1C7F